MKTKLKQLTAPVSYTHLDVYKRQFLFSTAQFYNAMQGGAPNAPLDC